MRTGRVIQVVLLVAVLALGTAQSCSRGGGSGGIGGGIGSGGIGSGGTVGGGTVGGGTGGGVALPPVDGTSCVPSPSSYTAAGQFRVERTSSGSTKLWIPQGLPAGCKVPIVHFANGTGARCSGYSATMTHLASHGMIGACFENSRTGEGKQAIEAIKTVLGQYPNIAAAKFGFSGHSQGGGASVISTYLAEQEFGANASIAAMAVEPAHGYGEGPSNYRELYAQIQRSPVAMFNGSRDGLVSASWVRRGYSALGGIQKAWYQAEGAGHLSPIPNEWAKEMNLAWFQWQLNGDPAACQYFKNMPNDRKWSKQETGNLAAC